MPDDIKPFGYYVQSGSQYCPKCDACIDIYDTINRFEGIHENNYSKKRKIINLFSEISKDTTEEEILKLFREQQVKNVMEG